MRQDRDEDAAPTVDEEPRVEERHCHCREKEDRWEVLLGDEDEWHMPDGHDQAKNQGRLERRAVGEHAGQGKAAPPGLLAERGEERYDESQGESEDERGELEIPNRRVWRPERAGEPPGSEHDRQWNEERGCIPLPA